jgi:hypothetical protein
LAVACAASDLSGVAYAHLTRNAGTIRTLVRAMAGAMAGAMLTAPTVRSQDVKQQEIYHGTISGVYVRVSAATDRGLEISAAKPPDHVLLSAVLPELATSWVDSSLRVLTAQDTTGHGTVTLSSGMLADSTHSAASLDHVFNTATAAPCSLFFTDGANLNHVRVDIPCAAAQQFLDAVRRAATAQATYDQTDSTSPAAMAAKAMRATSRRQDSLGVAAREQLTRHQDSAAGAIR